jgi:competence protein ComEC
MMATDVHVLNVGAGSCTVAVASNGDISMVDINDGSDQRSYEPEASEQPLTNPYDWMRDVLGTTDVFRFILSHPDADHMAGIRLAFQGALSILNFWDLPHHRSKTEFRNDDAKADWLWYEAFRQGIVAAGVTWPKRIKPMRADTGDFWTTDEIEILSPTPGLVQTADKSDDYNDASYVLRFQHAGRGILLASDVEAPTWNDMIDNGVPLSADVLIASHHGRKSGFSEEALGLIAPEVVIVSTAKLDSKDDAIKDYERLSDHVFSTRLDGDINVRMWDDGDLDVYDGAGDMRLRLYA